jgi:hypothetical protein
MANSHHSNFGLYCASVPISVFIFSRSFPPEWLQTLTVLVVVLLNRRPKLQAGI